MRLGPSLERYKYHIQSAIFDYAYVNYHIDPILEQVDIDQWAGEIFNVKDIAKDLHIDIVEDLKTIGIYDRIIKECDKFVILPDVWSNSKIPITGPTFPRNQYDTDRRNVVILNDKVFELKDIKMKSIWYNHNRLLYCFYKDSLSGQIFTPKPGQRPSMSVIWLYEHGFMVDNIKGNEDKWNIAPDNNKEWFKFMIDENNRITTNNNIDRVGIAINCDYIELDYENTVDPRMEVHIPGMESFGKDTWIRPKWYNMENERKEVIHNTNTLFTNTFIIFYKDDSYKICNTYVIEKDGPIEKVDKHTIKIDKDENIKKIILFVRPFFPSEYPPVDSLYYKAVAENINATDYLKKYKKYTNDLFNYMMLHSDIPVEKFIEYGYKYDEDILKVIQNFFKTVNELNPMTDVSYVIPNEENMFYKPKIFVRIWNKLQAYPVLFINHRMYMADYRIIKNGDVDNLVIDPEQLFKFINDTAKATRGVIPDYDPPVEEADDYRDLWFIQSNFEKLVTDLKVVFVNYNYLHKDPNSRQSGRIFRTPLYRRELILDEDINVGDENTLFKGYQFVNGYLNNTRFDNKLYRRLDGINFFDNGPLDFTVTAKASPSDTEVYNKTGKTSIFNGYNTSLLINRLNDPLLGICNCYFSGLDIIHSCDYTHAGQMPIIDENNRLKEYGTVCFDKYGIECSDHIDILSGKYASCDNMYNYVANKELDDRIVVHFIPSVLKDEIRDYDLEIDRNRISKEFNKGSFNDNAMEDEYVRALFIPNEPSEVRAIPVKPKSNKILLGQKILTRYWLGGRGVVTNTAEFTKEVSGLNGTFVKPDGTIGSISTEFKPFTDYDDLRGDNTPLMKFIVGMDTVYNMFVGYGINYINYNENYVDSSNTYEASMTDTYGAHTEDNTLNLFMDNDMFIKKGGN